MRALLSLLTILSVGAGCVFFVDDDHDDDCHLREATANIAPAPLRNPQTLQCESHGGTCDPACGPCPLLEPLPSWPNCGHSCEQLGEAACEADAQCRVVKDADCMINLNCLTDFVGCFPIDSTGNETINCFAADAWNCSRSNECSALHSYEACPNIAECARPFELCVPEGSSPGRCWDQVSCRAAPPECPTNTTPGIANSCYTGACIPLAICEPM